MRVLISLLSCDCSLHPHLCLRFKAVTFFFTLLSLSPSPVLALSPQLRRHNQRDQTLVARGCLCLAYLYCSARLQLRSIRPSVRPSVEDCLVLCCFVLRGAAIDGVRRLGVAVVRSHHGGAPPSAPPGRRGGSVHLKEI